MTKTYTGHRNPWGEWDSNAPDDEEGSWPDDAPQSPVSGEQRSLRNAKKIPPGMSLRDYLSILGISGGSVD